MVKRIGTSLMLALALSLSACGGTDSSSGEQGKRGEGVCSGQKCKFGQIAKFTATAGSGPSRAIEITVAAPESFTPKKGPEVEGADQEDNVFFKVTIKNLSDTESWNPTILTYLTSDGSDGSQIYTNEHCCAGMPEKVAPGKSATFRDEWSVADADDVIYRLDIDGLAGHSITFTR